MAQTTTHTTSAAVEARGCPTWCTGGHEGPDPDHGHCVLHGWQSRSVDTNESAVRIELTRWDDECGVGAPQLTIFSHDDPYPEVILNPEQAVQLIAELIAAVNLTLSVEEQQHLGQPGHESVCFDGPWG